jgi:hypothetical protein
VFQAFVIHIRHATISIFHAHLPNTYLSNIHVHGPRYSALFPTTPKIRLKQYGPWNMRHTQDQASLYRVLARVLWFLASGRSHVGYLAKCRGNPFVAKEVLNPVVCVTQVFVLCLFRGGGCPCCVNCRRALSMIVWSSARWRMIMIVVLPMRWVRLWN